LQETGKKGVNVLIDFIGKNYWKQNMEVLGLDGHMVILAFMSGKVNMPRNCGL
jgi:NADPH:quinone reductase-like Zn-dependent oxidoreductase